MDILDSNDGCVEEDALYETGTHYVFPTEEDNWPDLGEYLEPDKYDNYGTKPVSDLVFLSDFPYVVHQALQNVQNGQKG